MEGRTRAFSYLFLVLSIEREGTTGNLLCLVAVCLYSYVGGHVGNVAFRQLAVKSEIGGV